MEIFAAFMSLQARSEESDKQTKLITATVQETSTVQNANVYINIKLEMNTKLESYLSQIYSYCVYNNSNMILI